MQILSWIPQAFYDLIGRCIPGALLLSIVFWLFPESRAIMQSAVTSVEMAGLGRWPAIVLFGMLSYSIGLLLGGIGFFLDDERMASKKLDSRSDSIIGFKYRAIGHFHPENGGRLVKLSAELHACRVVIVGMVFVVIFHAARNMTFNYLWLYHEELAIVVIAGFSAYVFRIHLRKRRTECLEDYWRILIHDPKIPNGIIEYGCAPEAGLANNAVLSQEVRTTPAEVLPAAVVTKHDATVGLPKDCDLNSSRGLSQDSTLPALERLN